MTDLYDDDSVASIASQVDGWLAEMAATNPVIAAVDRHDGDPIRWYVRMRGEAKDFITVWLTLGQRTVQYEAYVIPAPEENHAALYENLLRRNERLVGLHFAIGIEDAVFVRGDLPLAVLTEPELDRVLGTVYATVEQCFTSLLHLGFASRFATPPDEN
jgi:hypothetical protein